MLAQNLGIGVTLGFWEGWRETQHRAQPQTVQTRPQNQPLKPECGSKGDQSGSGQALGDALPILVLGWMQENFSLPSSERLDSIILKDLLQPQFCLVPSDI